jgi:hypothetical protein
VRCGWLAPSPWKTGIRIARTFSDAPINAPGFRLVPGDGERLSEAEVRVIEGEVKGR